MTPDTARVTAWVEEAAKLFPAAPEPFWQRCGCLAGLGEIPSASDCHQAGLCAMRQQAERRRDDAARALLAVVRGVAELAEEHRRWAVINRDLADRVEGTDRDFHIGMAQAQESSVRHLRKLLADAAPDTEKETGK